jgi:hypothetical protein
MAFGKYVIGTLGIGSVYYAVPALKSDPVPTFPLAAQVVFDRIEAKERVVNGTGMGSLRLTASRLDDGLLRVSVKKAGNPKSVPCQVIITAIAADRSSANVDCSQPQLPDQPMRRVGVKALEMVVREHVAATAGNREYNVDAVADRMIGLAITERATFAASMQEKR